jgi:hypothetical protein
MFGLFKSPRKVATSAAIEAIRPLVASIQHSRGLPAGFWTAPYILGFTFTAGHHAKLATRGSVKEDVLGLVIGDALASVSNLNGSALVQRMLSVNDEFDFNRGADDAAAICFYTLRILRNEAENELVRRAAMVAERSTDAGRTEEERRSYIASMMVMLSLMSELDNI